MLQKTFYEITNDGNRAFFSSKFSSIFPTSSITQKIIYVEVILYFLSGAAGIFVKHVQSGMCINDTSIRESQPESWGYLIFLELSDNCLDPAVQFRFRDNSAMVNLKRQRCLVPGFRFLTYNLDMFYTYVAPGGIDKSCANDNNYRTIINPDILGRFICIL